MTDTPSPSPDEPSDEYDLKPTEKERRPKPGDPDFVPPVPIIVPADRAPEPETQPIDPDIEQNKAMAILAYILFVIPLVAAPKSPYARFHANQGLLLFIIWCIAIFIVIVSALGYSVLHPLLWRIEFIRFMLGCMCTALLPGVLVIGSLALTILGIINAANGERKGLPLIGHWTLIK